MKAPQRIRIGPFTYTVKTVVGVMDELGGTDSDHLVIALNGAYPWDALRETLVHEVLHAVLNVTGLARELGEEWEERVVRATAPVLTEVLRRNPRLVEAIVS